MFAAAVAALTLWLVWLGYGYDMAYLAEFGLSPEQVGHGTSDFLLRSYKPVLAMAEWLVKFQTWETQRGILFALAWPVGAIAAFATVVSAIGAYAYSIRNHGWTRQERWLATCFLAVWRSKPVVAIRELVSPLTVPARGARKVWTNARARWMNRTRLVGFAGGLAVGGLFAFNFYALVVVFAVALGIAITAVAGWPLTAVQTGSKSAREDVINPKECGKLSSYEGPHCVRIVVRGCELARGRLIDRTSQRIFIFMSAQRAHVDFPIADAVVEEVSTEDVPPQPKSCTGR